MNASDFETFADALAAVDDGGKIVLSEDIAEAITIDKPVTIAGNGATLHGVTVTNAAVTIDDVTLAVSGESNKDTAVHAIAVTGAEDFTLVNATVEGTCRTAAKLATSGKVTIEGCTFKSDVQSIYNMIEFSISNDPDITSVIMENNTFEGETKNNLISFYNLAEGAEVKLSNCQMTGVSTNSNVLRISNPKNASAVFNVENCTYKYSSTTTTDYTGFVLFQDYAASGDKQDFSKIQLNFTKLYRGSKKVTSNGTGLDRVYYIYDDQDGILADGINDPIVAFN